MTDRAELLRDFIDSALALMQEGLQGLSEEKAVLLDQAQKMGADVALIFCPGAGTVVGAVHMEGSDADPVTLFQILLSPSGVEH